MRIPLKERIHSKGKSAAIPIQRAQRSRARKSVLIPDFKVRIDFTVRQRACVSARMGALFPKGKFAFVFVNVRQVLKHITTLISGRADAFKRGDS